MKLINRLVSTARSKHLTSVILTFDPHPLDFFYPEKKVPRICDLAEMERILKDVGVDYLIQLPFTEEMAAMEPEQFWSDVLINRLKTQFMIVGEDHQFGHDRKGNPGTLKLLGKKSGVDVAVESHVYEGDSPVSSTRIRRMIEEGDLSRARHLLGHGLFFTGLVLHGAGRGQQLGFPTANMALPGRVLPPPGVFVSRTSIDDDWKPSISYIGRSPTFNGQTLWLETHLIGWDQPLYDRIITVDLITRLRPEIVFASRESLIRQMKIDRDQAITFFQQNCKGECK
ncbi:riboflavin biosynthesis protein RibF [bacterium]|nr:riboflavin biosynthesis protein RibF [candidate division CSSED10-310 bacterium]